MARGFSSAPGASPEVEAARQDALTKDEIAAFGRSRNPLVREAIAKRPDCPFGLTVSLAHDRIHDVRIAVAGNPGAVRTVFELLTGDPNRGVLEALAGNPSMPRDLLEVLTGCRSPRAAEIARARLAGQDLPQAPEPAKEQPGYTGGARHHGAARP